MGLDASQFINNRINKLSLTKSRINNILIAVIDSYQAIKIKNIVFDCSKANIGSIKQEVYLRNRLVDGFLIDELKQIKDGSTNYIVSKDSEEQYDSIRDGGKHNDPIDIQIFDSGLDVVWGVNQAYFAIECKRFPTGGVTEYVRDIEKFTDRTYKKLRLPFEGQLGFIEKKGLTHYALSNKINNNLSSTTCMIETNKQLDFYQVKNDFDGSYHSEHKRKNGNRFEIYHLFFDYSKHIFR